ncbi:MAG: sulfatase [Candidatus Lindowbacteria bacterium]|nr:sulfatase [Candidatus Lindowbacteria bacterium]
MFRRLFNRTRRANDSPTNVVLILLDALRWDGLSCYGNKRKTSPNIDKLAKRSIVFTQAISAAGATPGSIGALMTSKYPRFVKETFAGPRELADFGFSRFTEEGESIASLPRSMNTLAKSLSRTGYATAGFTANPLTTSDFGFTNGFDSYEEYCDRRDWDIRPNAKTLNEKVNTWLLRNSRERFFLYLHYMDIHHPYTPCAPYNRMFKAKYLEDKTDVDLSVDWYHSSDIDYLRECSGHMRAVYDASIRYVDDQLATLFKTFDKLDLLNNSVIIVLSDHGDEFLEHGGTLHHNPKLHDELIRVPFLMHLPCKSRAKRIGRLVRTVDIMPTILELAGVEPPTDIEGISLLPLVLGSEGRLPELEAYADAPFRHAIRTERWKLIQDEKANTYELYDLVSDPSESKNLFGTRAEAAKTMLSKLAKIEERIAAEGDRAARADHELPGKSIDEEIARRLRALGYL